MFIIGRPTIKVGTTLRCEPLGKRLPPTCHRSAHRFGLVTRLARQFHTQGRHGVARIRRAPSHQPLVRHAGYRGDQKSVGDAGLQSHRTCQPEPGFAGVGRRRVRDFFPVGVVYDDLELYGHALPSAIVDHEHSLSASRPLELRRSNGCFRPPAERFASESDIA